MLLSLCVFEQQSSVYILCANKWQTMGWGGDCKCDKINTTVVYVRCHFFLCRRFCVLVCIFFICVLCMCTPHLYICTSIGIFSLAPLLLLLPLTHWIFTNIFQHNNFPCMTTNIFVRCVAKGKQAVFYHSESSSKEILTFPFFIEHR